MIIKKWLIAVVAVVTLLAGCGGGGDSSSGGGTSGGVTYLGSEELNIRPRGSQIIETDTLGLEININGGAVVIIDSDGMRYTGSIDASGNFTATGSALSGDIGLGITCEPLVLTYRGRLSGNTVSGTFSGFAKCVRPGGPVVILDATGEFSASI